MSKIRGIFFRPAPQGSQLHQGKRGDWWVRYTDHYGRLHREKVGPKGLAQEVYRKRKTEIREGKFFPETLKRRPTLLLEVEAHSYLALAKATKRGYPRERSALKKLCQAPEFTGKTLDAIRPADVERYVARMCDAKVPPATLHRDLAVLRRLYSLAVRDGKVDANPLQGIRLPKINNARTRYLTEDEERRLFETLPDRLKPLVTVALHTGLRWSEQMGLTWEDVDFYTGLLRVKQSKHGEARRVPMNSVVGETLQALRQAQIQAARHQGDREILSPYVFCRPDGRPWRYHQAWYPLRMALTRAGLTDFTWHDLRHTYASRLVMAGVDLYTVKELLGHKLLEMTQRYAHLSPRHLREAVERLTPRGTSTRTDTAFPAHV